MAMAAHCVRLMLGGMLLMLGAAAVPSAATATTTVRRGTMPLSVQRRAEPGRRGQPTSRVLLVLPQPRLAISEQVALRSTPEESERVGAIVQTVQHDETVSHAGDHSGKL